jgi:hypothetical protein
MLIKAVLTGSPAKRETVVRTITVEGVKLRLTECDTWSSGEYAGDGRYVRTTTLEMPSPVDPWPNIKMPKGHPTND